jgi:hypothetical protein
MARDIKGGFAPEEGYTRYRLKDEDYWCGSMSSSLLTPEKIQVMRFQGYIFDADFSNISDLKITSPPKEAKKMPRLKKSELEENVNYILCPDKKCGLFWDERFERIACESNCPYQDKMQKMVVCSACKEPIYLLGDNHPFQRVEHIDCPSGHNTMMFTRMSPKYRLIYQKPN